MDSPKFFEAITGNVFHTVSEHAAVGINALLAGCKQFGVTDPRMIAYILGTAWWETGKTMQPISEYGYGSGHAYGKKIKHSGEHYETPDKIYFGRGFTQNTWYENYEMLSHQSYAKSKGWDFLNNPDLLLETEPSVWATIHCMWHGSYTGVSLLTYFNSSKTDWFNARKIVNGLDQATTIAGTAQHFYGAIQIASPVVTA